MSQDTHAKKIAMTEYLAIDLECEKWCCRVCERQLGSARRDYKEGLLVANRDPAEVHFPLLDPEKYDYTFTPNRQYTAMLEFCCPGCGTMITVEYLPPGHRPTYDLQFDVDALKEYWKGREQDLKQDPSLYCPSAEEVNQSPCGHNH